MSENFTVKPGTSADEIQSTQWAALILAFVDANTPSEEIRPGAGSLMAYALCHACGVLLSRCPKSDRGATIESMQTYLAGSAHFYGDQRDAVMAQP